MVGERVGVGVSVEGGCGWVKTIDEWLGFAVQQVSQDRPEHRPGQQTPAAYHHLAAHAEERQLACPADGEDAKPQAEDQGDQ